MQKEIKQKPIVTRLKQRILKEFPQIKLKDFKIPLTNGEDCGTLRDILEDKVDEKYYVDPKRYEGLDLNNV